MSSVSCVNHPIWAWEASPGDAPIAYAGLLMIIGNLHRSQQRFKDALEVFEKAQNAFESSGATATTDYLQLLSQLAGFHYEQVGFFEGGWPFCLMMIFWKCWEHVPDVCTMWILTVWIPSFSNRFFPGWQGNLNFALKKYSNAQAAYEAWTSQIADLWQKPFQSRSNSSSHLRKSGDLDKGMGTLKKTNISQGKHVFHKMRWMSVRLSGGRRLVAQKQKATLVSCKALEAVSICVSDSRGSWNFNKSFEVAKLPFSSFPAPKFFAHLIWIPHFFHSGLGAVYTKLGWSEEAMSKMIEAQEAFQVGLGMAEMRDEGNMHNISQYVHLLYNYILNCV